MLCPGKHTESPKSSSVFPVIWFDIETSLLKENLDDDMSFCHLKLDLPSNVDLL